ncbi:MAG: hypothetical protein IT163_13100 [Bryobacterales bacterium]|nr:hypothetical protein [Bryobacterales bacterium]
MTVAKYSVQGAALVSCLMFFPACPTFAQAPTAGGQMLQLPSEVIGMGMRHWENGFIAIREPEKSSVVLYDRGGKRLWSTKIGFPDAVETSLRTVAIWPDGSVAVGGGARSADGALAGFIALIDSGGNTKRIVRTTPYIAWHMAVAGDGRLWTFGRRFLAPEAKVDEPHQMVRSFSKEGVQEAAYFPRQSFTKWPHPASGADLVLFRDRVGLYVTSRGEWVELSAETGEVRTQTKIAQPSDFVLRGAAYGPNGELYVSGSRLDREAKKTVPVLAKVDPQSGAWTDLTASLEPDGIRASTIAGVDGNLLVLADGAPEVYSYRMQ